MEQLHDSTPESNKEATNAAGEATPNQENENTQNVSQTADDSQETSAASLAERMRALLVEDDAPAQQEADAHADTTHEPSNEAHEATSETSAMPEPLMQATPETHSETVEATSARSEVPQVSALEEMPEAISSEHMATASTSDDDARTADMAAAPHNEAAADATAEAQSSTAGDAETTHAAPSDGERKPRKQAEPRNEEPLLTPEMVAAMPDEEIVAFAERLINSENPAANARQINALFKALSPRLRPRRVKNDAAIAVSDEAENTPEGEEVVISGHVDMETDAQATAEMQEMAASEGDASISETTTSDASTSEVSADTEAGTPDLQDPTTLLLRSLFDKYFERRDRMKAEQDKHRGENMQKKQAILDRLKDLAQNDETSAIYDEFKTLQNQWRDIGHVPAEQQKELWTQYHFYIDKFYDNLKINRELKELDFKKNLDQKVELCERAEALILEPSINKSVDTLNELHEKWKGIGPVPRDKKDEIWDRFKDASDKVYDRRKEHYDRVNEEQMANLALKEAVLARAEEALAVLPTTLKEWQQKSDVVTALQAEWKAIGFAPRKQNEELWARFKAICDEFFRGRTTHFKNHRQEQINNQHLKTDLAVQAEALKDSKDWKQTGDELMRLQEEWKKIGPAPAKVADKLWKRFRSACDEFFKNRAANAKQRDGEQDENMRKKQELIARVEAYQLGEDHEENFENLKAIQREWMDIGFVPFREREGLQSRFRAAINVLFDTLKANRPAGNFGGGGGGGNFGGERSNFGGGGGGFGGGAPRRDGGQGGAGGPRRDRGESGGNRRDGRDAGNRGGNRRDGAAAPQVRLSPEEAALVSKIGKVQTDIDLWENNIEFFANSKNADALRKEVENKISRGKEEVKNLNHQLKTLRSPKPEAGDEGASEAPNTAPAEATASIDTPQDNA